MANPFRCLAVTLCLLLLPLAARQAQGEDGKELFQKECTSCHTIGGGDGAGPDLKGVAGRRSIEWLVRIIVEPDKLTADQDPAQL